MTPNVLKKYAKVASLLCIYLGFACITSNNPYRILLYIVFFYKSNEFGPFHREYFLSDFLCLRRFFACIRVYVKKIKKYLI